MQFVGLVYATYALKKKISVQSDKFKLHLMFHCITFHFCQIWDFHRLFGIRAVHTRQLTVKTNECISCYK